MDLPFRIPGTTEPEITIRRTAIGSIAVLVDGVRVKRRGFLTSTYDIPLQDVSVAELRVIGQWSGLKAVVNGVQIPLEPTIPRWTVVLVIVPLALVVGGLVGGLIGGIAMLANSGLARRAMPLPVKVGAMLGVIVLAAVVFVGLAYVIAPLPSLEAGSCVNGIRAGAEVTSSVAHPVDCASPHDNEVVGVASYTGEGPFPGQDALQAFAVQPCVAAFATYVGTTFEASTIDMIAVAPSDATWAKGDRAISCVALNTDGTKFTGSIKGSRR
jgi:hypothetical protein